MCWCCSVLMIFSNISVKVCKLASFFFFLLKLLGSIDEVAVGFFFCACLVSVE
jgi:hypothetical protein